jgi:hypothetical protein
MTSEKQFDVGDRVFSHYTMDWGTIRSIDRTYRDERHGVTGSALPDTTWYEVAFDEKGTQPMDDAHGNWDMARIVPERVARRYGYGPDPHPTV